MKRVPCFIVPPHILDAIAKNHPDEATRLRAKLDSLIMARLRDARTLIPVPGEPQEGEDREIRNAQQKEVENGPVARKEDQAPTSDASINRLYDGMGNVYKYYFEVHNRKSIDGNGMLMVASDHYGVNWDNAAWTGSSYVSGDGNYFNSFSFDLTVMGHEVTHGIDQFSRDMEPYYDQPGQLKEHVADWGGAMVQQYIYHLPVTDSHAWLVGEKLCEGKIHRDGGKPAALRDMLYPGTAYNDPVIGNDPQPADMAHYDSTPNDNGGVHINSGIPNRALATACVQRGGYAWEKIGLVWYDVLTQRISSNSPQFQEFANLTLVSSDAMFGSGSLESQAIVTGWKTVGITADATNPVPTPSPSPSSPCLDAFAKFLSDATALKYLRAAFATPSGKSLLARARLLGR